MLIVLVWVTTCNLKKSSLVIHWLTVELQEYPVAHPQVPLARQTWLGKLNEHSKSFRQAAPCVFAIIYTYWISQTAHYFESSARGLNLDYSRYKQAVALYSMVPVIHVHTYSFFEGPVHSAFWIVIWHSIAELHEELRYFAENGKMNEGLMSAAYNYIVYGKRTLHAVRGVPVYIALETFTSFYRFPNTFAIGYTN